MAAPLCGAQFGWTDGRAGPLGRPLSPGIAVGPEAQPYRVRHETNARIMSKERLDVMVAGRGLAESREQAQRVIRAGQVTVAGQVASKPGHRFQDDAVIEVLSSPPFVSRGGEKLQEAFTAFDLDVQGAVCVDIGASTGGFTDCLLQRGASKIYAVDVGKGLLHWNLRNDPRVVVIEKVNARYLDESSFPEPIAVATIDVSFISLTKILPAVTQVLGPGGRIVSLIKPQFEAKRQEVRRGGVIKDPEVHARIVEEIKSFGTGTLGLTCIGVCKSPLTGPAGNVEFLAYWQKPEQ